MKTSFLDYYKLILEKVSFDNDLLVKEYYKAIENISAQEKKSLDEWFKKKYSIPPG